ncbi:hypothetical protein [Phocaeicola plebeius]|jgi:hypothetical protein|nr:hypothetical protein [Phocaeicola plebeius]
MKNYQRVVLGLVSLFLAVDVQALPRAERVVMIALDGISVEGF